jgi:hypothetical protein
VDIQNALSSKSQGEPNYTFARNEDNTDWKTTDNLPLRPDGANAIPIILDNLSGSLLPTIGIIVEF